MDLFSESKMISEPLAARMRPRNLDEYIGQDHIVGKGRLLRRAIAADQLTSVIFYGPPGTGKTTLARVIANHTKSNFITLNAVLTGVQDIREAIKQADDYKALYSKRTILFVDEVHRWNKSQQDALLPWVENGTIILIGATTENPFFEVNKALVSRSRVFQLKSLTKEDLHKAAIMTLNDVQRGYGKWKIEFEQGALEHLIDTANGDARSLLNALELAIETTPEEWKPLDNPPKPTYGSTIFISKETAEESIQKKVVLYDRDGDYHYDIISAFIKSLRGRDPDAACYWLSRMISAGESPHFIFRRMLISACEDTGLADPYAITVVESDAQAFDRVGLPEGRFFLIHAALYLATAPKSNSTLCFFDALKAIEQESAEVPNHLKDASRDAEGFGHGEGYLYPHAYKDHWVSQQYLPNTLKGRVFYNPSTQGYEGKIRDEVLSRRELQIASLLEQEQEEQITQEDNQTKIKINLNNNSEDNLTFSPKDYAKENALNKADRFWQQRLNSNKAQILLQIRDTMIQKAGLLRHHRSLIWNADSGLLIWEVARKQPEGVTCGVCKTEKGKSIIEQYSRTLTELDRPLLQVRPSLQDNAFLTCKEFYQLLLNFQYKGTIFDRFFFIDPFVNKESITALADAFLGLVNHDYIDNLDEDDQDDNQTEEQAEEQTEYISPLAQNFKIIISQKIPINGQRLSDLIINQILNSETISSFEDIIQKMQNAENNFYNDQENTLFTWDSNFINDSFIKNDFNVKTTTQDVSEKKRLTKEEIQKWFNKENSSYAKKLCEQLEEGEVTKIKNLLENASENTLFNWKNQITYYEITL